jgi:hypothetical protein
MSIFPTNATYTFNSVEYSMVNRKPDRGFNISTKYDSALFTSQSGYEKTRLISRRSKRTLALSYTNISGVYKQAIENFYKARSGEYETFEFDLAHVGESGSMLVRFSGELRVTNIVTTDSLLTSIFSVSFNLVETYS